MQVLFLDSVHPSLDEMLKAHGFNCHYDYTSTYDEVLGKLDTYTGIVIRSRIPVDRNLIAAGKNLKFIARSGAGLENIDLIAAAEAGIKVLNSPEGNRDAVGEHGIGMLLMLFNRMHLANAEIRAGKWDREGNRGTELGSKTVGIIGYGLMGSAFAEKLQGFGCQILAYDKYKTGFANDFVEETSLDQLQAEADIISLHLPLSEETIYYFDQAFIDACSKPVYLLNTGRGKHVDTKSLVAGLRNGKILGACLDVIEYEKSSFENIDAPEAYRELLQFDNVILSPHVAGWTKESYLKLSKFLGEKVLSLGLGNDIK